MKPLECNLLLPYGHMQFSAEIDATIQNCSDLKVRQLQRPPSFLVGWNSINHSDMGNFEYAQLLS